MKDGAGRAWADGFAGAAAGVAAKTATAPLERVKMVLQNQELSVVKGVSKATGLRDALAALPKTDGGVLSLWRGNGANLLRVVPTYGSRFAIFPRADAALRRFDLPSDARRLVSGACAGAGGLLLTHPLDTTRTRLSATRTIGSAAYSGVAHCMRLTVRKEGVRGLYAGFTVSLIEIAPYTAVAFAGYEGAKRRCGRDGTATRLFCGWVSGVTATLLCYPLDTVRRQLMLDGSLGFDSRYHRSANACATRLWSDGGVRRLYRGVSAAMVKSAPAVAVTFCVNDALKDALAGV